jgi:UDP-N-acetylmuramyl pentapeptide phosphotransferase/UDP-N-acetylglucosamine-1-phosphate transferase
VSETIAFAAGAACVLSATAIVPLRRLALRWGLTDHPGGHKAHVRSTPYLGGIAIMVGTIVPTMIALGFADLRITAILLAATAVSILGLIDDIAPLSAITRLVVEMVVATGVTLSGVQVTVTGGWADGPLTVLWIVVMTNSFQGHMALGVLLSSLACAGLGFLPHNWPPARIFMGDSGSLFIGFTLTCSAVLLVMERAPGAAITGLLLPTFIATFDTCVVFLSRMLAGRSPLRGGTDHVSHRLRLIGLSTRTVAVALGAIAAITSALCLAMVLTWVSALTAVVATGAIAIVLISLLRGVNVHSPAQRPKAPQKIRERRR